MLNSLSGHPSSSAADFRSGLGVENLNSVKASYLNASQLVVVPVAVVVNLEQTELRRAKRISAVGRDEISRLFAACAVAPR